MDNKDLAELVSQAKKKDKEALSKLYEVTHNEMYYSALCILKNEQDAQDIIQESYITAFMKLNELRDSSLFSSWLRMIVVNNCKNFLKRKSPKLFNSDEEETTTLDNIEEQSEDFLPQDFIEQQAKREQVIGIINQLPDVQRTSILLFYYNQLSIKEIAETMECNTNSVKSRLSYAKKYIRNEVDKLNSKGDKLYSMATTIPFLTQLLREDAKKHVMSEAVSKTILHSALTASTTAANITSAAGTGAGIFAKFAALTTIGKIAAVTVTAVALTGGGIAGVVAVKKSQSQAKPAMAIVSSSVSSGTGVDSQVAVKHSEEWLKAQEEAKAKDNATSQISESDPVYKKMADAMRKAGCSEAQIQAELAALKGYHGSQTGTSSSSTTSKPSTSNSSGTTSKPSGTTSQKPATDWGAAEGPIGGSTTSDDGSCNSNIVGGSTAANSDPRAAIH